MPNAETAFKIADIMFRTHKDEDYYRAAGSAKDVEYDERYDVWIVPGEIVYINPNYFIKNIPTVIVKGRYNGEVIAFW